MPQATTAKGFGRQAVNPLVGGDGLTGLRIRSETRPVAFLLDLLVRDRAFDHQHERIELALFRLIPEFQEVISVFVGQDGIVQVHFGKSGNGSQQNVFDAGLSSCGD